MVKEKVDKKFFGVIKIPVECYSRVVGYFRPVEQWNEGKQEEFKQRKTLKIRSYKR